MTPHQRLANARVLLQRPLLLAFVLGCLVSALSSGRLSVRLIIDGAMSLAFVPAIEIAAFAVVRRTRLRGTGVGRSRIPFAHALDAFSAGDTPWLFWLVGLVALGSVVPSRQIGPWLLPVFVSALIPVVWSIYLDFHFFRDVMQRPARAAIRDVVLHRAIGWVSATAYFFGIAIWYETLPALAKWAAL